MDRRPVLLITGSFTDNIAADADALTPLKFGALGSNTCCDQQSFCFTLAAVLNVAAAALVVAAADAIYHA